MNNTRITPELLLQLITETFNGECFTELTTGEYRFDGGFSIDSTVEDESIYLSTVEFNYKIKYNFFYGLVSRLSQCSNSFKTIRQRDNFINQLFDKLSKIYASNQSSCKIYVLNGKIISLIFGKKLPETSAADYKYAGIPEYCENYTIEIGEDPWLCQDYWNGNAEPDNVIVISKDYFRLNGLEYCNNEANLLISPKYEPFFFSDDKTQNGTGLNAYISICHNPSENYSLNYLFSRVDAPRRCTTNNWYTRKNKDLFVLVDETELRAISGYIKLPIRFSEDSMQGKLDAATASGATVLYKNVPIAEKDKLTKHGKYAVIASIGPLFVLQKTDKCYEIARKTENTRTFRADVLNNLLNPVLSWILCDELDCRNLVQPTNFISPSITSAVAKDIATEISIMPGADFTTLVPFINTKVKKSLQVDENLFKTKARDYVKKTFETDSRAGFFGMMKSWAGINNNSQPGLYINDCVYKSLSNDDLRYHPYSFKDTLLTINFSNLLRSLFSSTTYRYSAELKISKPTQLLNFYNDNFIPQSEIENNINKLTEAHCANNSLNSYHFPEGIILPSECITVSSEVVKLMNSAGAIKSYSELNTWFSFVKTYIETTTIPSLTSKLNRNQSLTTILHTSGKITVYLQYVEWVLAVLEQQETEQLTK